MFSIISSSMAHRSGAVTARAVVPLMPRHGMWGLRVSGTLLCVGLSHHKLHDGGWLAVNVEASLS